MKATTFAGFFEFSIYKKKGYDEECGDYNYIVVDNQGVFHTRHIEYIEDLVDCFDSMLPDYIDSDIEQYGFIYDETKKDSYYEQALEWIKTSELSDDLTADIIYTLVHGDNFEDDTKDYNI